MITFRKMQNSTWVYSRLYQHVLFFGKTSRSSGWQFRRGWFCKPDRLGRLGQFHLQWTPFEYVVNLLVCLYVSHWILQQRQGREQGRAQRRAQGQVGMSTGTGTGTGMGKCSPKATGAVTCSFAHEWQHNAAAQLAYLPQLVVVCYNKGLL